MLTFKEHGGGGGGPANHQVPLLVTHDTQTTLTYSSLKEEGNLSDLTVTHLRHNLFSFSHVKISQQSTTLDQSGFRSSNIFNFSS